MGNVAISLARNLWLARCKVKMKRCRIRCGWPARDGPNLNPGRLFWELYELTLGHIEHSLCNRSFRRGTIENPQTISFRKLLAAHLHSPISSIPTPSILPPAHDSGNHYSPDGPASTVSKVAGAVKSGDPSEFQTMTSAIAYRVESQTPADFASVWNTFQISYHLD